MDDGCCRVLLNEARRAIDRLRSGLDHVDQTIIHDRSCTHASATPSIECPSPASTARRTPMMYSVMPVGKAPAAALEDHHVKVRITTAYTVNRGTGVVDVLV